MGILSRLLGRRSKVDTAFAELQDTFALTTRAAALAVAEAPVSPNAVRKQAVRVVLKETLNRNGIPCAWISVDVLVAKSRNRSTGLHVRFVMRHWDLRLAQHALDLQDSFNARLLLLDADAGDWLMGYSWQYKLERARKSPGLPHPNSWTSIPVESKHAGTGVSARPGWATEVTGRPAVIPSQPVETVPCINVQPDAEMAADLAALLAVRIEDVSRKPA